MPSKRKAQSSLDRRVRPRRDEESDVDLSDSRQGAQFDDDSDSDAPSDQPVREERGTHDESEDDEDEAEEEDGQEQEDEESQPKVDLSSVSFGALARAQAALPSSRKSKSNTKSKLESSTTSERENPRLAKREQRGEKQPKPSRSSKHAPQEQSSKKPVSRRREILADPRRKFRDPRFDPTMGKVDEHKARKAYSFLDDYRDSELADLKTKMKKSKNYDEKEDLKRQVMSMESKKKARLRKDEEERLLNEHRKKEKDLVAQGKTPFYLKKSEQKKQLLTNRFEKMSKGQVDRAIERKRKKVAGKEKKELDFLTRRRA